MSARDVGYPLGLFRLNADWLSRRPRKGWQVLMHIEPYGFFDDAGKWQDKDFICLCGYLSHGDHWQALSQRWRKALDDYGLDHLHIQEFPAEAKKRCWSETQAQNVLDRFASITRDHVLVGFSVGLDAKHYRGIPKDRKDGITKPNVACLQRVLRLIRDRVHEEQCEERITFALDEEEGSVIALYEDILKLRKSRPLLGYYIGAVCFADDKFMLPLQSADMLASLTYAWLRDRSLGLADENPTGALKSLTTDPISGRSLDFHSELWDAPHLDEALGTLLGKEGDA
jgi:hypothetical protein